MNAVEPTSGAHATVRLRPPGWRVSLVLGAIIVLALLVMDAAFSHDGLVTFDLPQVAAVAYVLAVAHTLGGDAVVTADGYRCRVPFRRVRLAWRDVAVLTTEQARDAVRIVAYLHDGSRVVLPFPHGPESARWRRARRADVFWRQVEEMRWSWESERARG